MVIVVGSSVSCIGPGFDRVLVGSRDSYAGGASGGVGFGFGGEYASFSLSIAVILVVTVQQLS